MSTEWPSLKILHTEIDSELARLERRGDASDAKLAVVIGLAGAVIAIGERTNGLGIAATLVAGCSAAVSLWAYYSRAQVSVSIRHVRDAYLMRSEPETELALLDTKIDAAIALAPDLERKARQVQRQPWHPRRGGHSLPGQSYRGQLKGVPLTDVSEQVTAQPQSAPPMRPDPNMIEHPEGNKHWRGRYRAHAQNTLAKANGQDESGERSQPA